jgi:hypothetical protein
VTPPRKEAVALLPASGLPLLYFGFAHLCLATAFAALTLSPSLPGEFFLHARMVAVVHLVTLGWISGSILGAFYIVGPLALRMPLRPGWRDRAAFGCYVAGVSGMVAHFWLGEYNGMAWSAGLASAAVLHVAMRAWRGLGAAVAPWGVKLHVALAFANFIAAAGLGILIGLNRLHGWVYWAPLPAAYAHAHLAAVGWATMMFVGLAYRLVPMIVPAAMPAGASIAWSAALLQTGVLVVAVSLLAGPRWTPIGALLIVAGLVSFVFHVRRMLRTRLPRPPALPRPDWATWQTHVALLWLLVTTALGVYLACTAQDGARAGLRWTYGTLGLIGFLSQVVLGIQGRLLPMHGWYRAFQAGGMQPPGRSAHALASPALARFTFLAWTVGVPVLALGLAAGHLGAISAAAAVLCAGVVSNALQAVGIARRAGGQR